MEKENVIDLVTYRGSKDDNQAADSYFMSEELKAAIQLLIHRLKEEGPIPQPR